MTKFYICKHCHSKIYVSYLAQHTMKNHIEKNYEIVEYDSQIVFELSNTGETITKTQMTKEQANKKYGFEI